MTAGDANRRCHGWKQNMSNMLAVLFFGEDKFDLVFGF